MDTGPAPPQEFRATPESGPDCSTAVSHKEATVATRLKGTFPAAEAERQDVRARDVRARDVRARDVRARDVSTCEREGWV
jgi:hypothetical protein